MRKIFIISTGCLLALTPFAPAFGQSTDAAVADDSDNSPIIIDEGRAFMDGSYTITVVGDQLASAQSNASVSLIGEDDIARSQNGAVSDLLARLPGVSVTRNGGLGSFTGVRIRGADAEQSLVVIDGVRVGDPSSPGGGFDFGSLLTGAIDTVEVLRGANSVPWGSQAIGGVVAVTTTRPSANANNRTEGQIQAEYGTYDTARINGQLRTSELPLGSFGIGGGYVRTDGFSSAANGSERDGFRQVSANFNSRSQIGSTVAVRTFGLLVDSRVDLDGFAPPTFSFGDTAELQKTREHYAGITLEHTPDDDSGASGFTHRVVFGFADVDRDNFDTPADAVAGFYARGRNERLSYALDWRPVGTFGGGWNRDDLRVLGGVEREWVRAITGSPFSLDSGKTATTSAWGQLVGKPTDSLSLTAGIRHDDHQDFGGATTWAGDASYRLSEQVAVRASYREGFKAPTLFQLSADPFAFGNPALQPERARSFELGLRASGPTWHFDSALFRRDSRNLIDFVNCPAGPNALPAICATGNRPFGTYDNINRARSEGLEVEAGFKLSSTLSLDANYSFVSVKDRTPGSVLLGNRLARRPRHSANAELIWQPDEALTGAEASAALRYVGSSFDDRANNVQLGEYVLVDVRASYPVLASIDLFARVENLFGEDYQTVAGYGTAGRSVFAGLRWSY